jgi:predicted Fe-S protein YdhL (DUF1289 family)
VAGGNGAQAASVAAATVTIHAGLLMRPAARIDEYLDIARSAAIESGIAAPSPRTPCHVGELRFFNTKQSGAYARTAGRPLLSCAAKAIQRTSARHCRSQSNRSDHLNMAIQSPCVDICKIDGTSGFCIGCLRTRDEIREWKSAEDERRQQIIDGCAARVAMLPATAAPAIQSATPAS